MNVSAKKKRSQTKREGARSGACFPTNGAWPHIASRFNPRSVMITVQMEQSVSFLATSTVAASATAFQASLSGFSNYANYTALFDQYRFVKLQGWVMAGATQATTGAPENGVYVTCVDLDDAAVPAGFNSVAMGQGAIQSSDLAGHYHEWVPAAADAMYSGAFTSYGNVTSPWIDCSSPSVQHYGLKIAAGASTTALTFTLIVRATVQFRGISIA